MKERRRIEKTENRENRTVFFKGEIYKRVIETLRDPSLSLRTLVPHNLSADGKRRLRYRQTSRKQSVNEEKDTEVENISLATKKLDTHLDTNDQIELF